MQLSLIRDNYPAPEDGKTRLWINPEDRGIYFGLDRIFLNYDDPDSPATIGDLDRELNRRDYFAIETKFIDSSGDLVLNTFKNNIEYDKITHKIRYKMCEVVDKSNNTLGITLRTYKRLEADYLNSADSTLLSIDFLDDSEKCKIVFPEDKASSVNLSELAKKYVIPGVSCELSDLRVSFRTNDSSEYQDSLLYNEYNYQTLFGGNQILFEYRLDKVDNQYRRYYNTNISSTVLSLGFVLDLTEDGLLSLHYYPSSSNHNSSITITDYYIKSCSVKFKYLYQ
jgi:hypothetical protein